MAEPSKATNDILNTKQRTATDNTKLWNGAFQEDINAFLEQFNESVSEDQILYEDDIEGSIAHVTMLSHCNIIEEQDKQLIVETLQEIKRDIENGKLELKIELEDIHMNIEAELIRRIGDVGRKLHTGRSRNDQVITDLRLFTRKNIKTVLELLVRIIEQLTRLAQQHHSALMPGFTHFQFAQPISLGHYLLAYACMFKRDVERFLESWKRVNVNPLGSAALAGTTHPIDRFLTTKLLNFASPSENSLDAISDRDFIVEFTSNCSLTIMHLTRISEEFIIFMNPQFDFVALPDSLLTGSSIMPQKKNPDMLELIRGKSGRIYGSLINILTILKCQPLAYNKDLQECKQPLFDSIKTITMCLKAFEEIINKVEFNQKEMNLTANKGFSIATDIADYLVKKQIPFRICHGIVGKMIKYCTETKKSLTDLSLNELKQFHSNIDEDIFEIFSVRKSIENKNQIGSTSPVQVLYSVTQFEQFVNDIKTVLSTI